MKPIASFCAAALAFAGLALPAHAQDDAAATDAAAQAQPAQAQPQEAAPQPAEQPAPGAADPAAADVEEVSYAIGYMVGREYRRQEVALKPEVFLEGLKTGLAGEEARVSLDELRATLMNFQRELQLRQMQKFQAQAAAGRAYLEENKQKEGVQTTASGLQYEVLKEGEGESPSAQDAVRVHYRGTLTDGTQFDSSYDRGEPATFRVNEVIPGWSEALQLMKEGGKYRLTIPAELAYGEAPPPGSGIPPHAVLLFDVELLDVVK